MLARAGIAAALVAGVVAVFAPLRDHDFVDYDDPVWIAKLEPGLSRQGLETAFADEIVANWIPVSVLSMLIDRELHGGSARGYLLGNLLLHAASTAGLFWVLAGTTGAVFPSAFVAAVFGVHPLHVESVAWISQRKDVLCGLFWVLALGLHTRAARRPSRGRRAATLAAVALALLSKPTAVTLPFVLVLFEWWPLARLERSPRSGLPTLRALAASLREKLPMLALAAAVSVVTFRVQAATGAVAAADALPFPLRLANAVDSLRAYLADAFWPRGLAAFYPHEMAIASPLVTLASALALIALSLALVLGARRLPAGIVGWLWFLGTLVPVLGLVQVGLQARADRYTYLPLIGLAMAVAFPLAQLAAPRASSRRALGALALAAVAALGVAARAQVHSWRDSLSLYARAVEVAPPSAFAHLGLGRALRRAGRGDEAVEHLGLAAQLDVRDPISHLELAEHFATRGDLRFAIAHQRAATERAPDDARFLVRLGQLLLQAGRPLEARIPLARAEDLLAHGAEVSVPLRRLHALASARAALAVGDDHAARRHADAVLAVDPESRGAREVLEQLALREARSEPPAPRPDAAPR
jgi:tetratricopeptide (TPR) repeat protein